VRDETYALIKRKKMATIKVKFRESSVQGKAGTVYYQLSHRRQVQHIATSIHLLPSEWNFSNECPQITAENSQLIRSRIDGDVALLGRIIKQFDNSGIPYTVSDIVRQFKRPESHIYILTYMRAQIEQLRHNGRLGTAKNYERALNSFSQFMKEIDIPFCAMNELLIDNYNTYLFSRGIVRNSVSFYMRIWRAVYNKAVRHHLAEPTNPFQNVYTGVDRTTKRAINEDMISRLYKLDIPTGSRLDMARDLFIFSYCTRGMAFVDMAYLKKSNISNDMISYTRHKTSQRLCIRIEPRIRQIIDKYASAVERTSYVFPILKEQGFEENYNRYRFALNAYNSALHKLGAMLPDKCRLTSYTSRHSWATAARNHNIPISVISACMGHTSERTTQIYLAMLENSVMDTANRKIINTLK